MAILHRFYSKTCVNGLSQKDQKLVSKTKYRLMQVKSIVECSKEYSAPSLSYHLSLRSLFCLFLSGRFTQVLLNVPFSTTSIRGDNTGVPPFWYIVFYPFQHGWLSIQVIYWYIKEALKISQGYHRHPENITSIS